MSTDAEKALEKIQLPIMIKTLRKIGIEENFLNLIINIYKSTIANIISTGERLDVLFLRLRESKDILS